MMRRGGMFGCIGRHCGPQSGTAPPRHAPPPGPPTGPPSPSSKALTERLKRLDDPPFPQDPPSATQLRVPRGRDLRALAKQVGERPLLWQYQPASANEKPSDDMEGFLHRLLRAKDQGRPSRRVADELYNKALMYNRARKGAADAKRQQRQQLRREATTRSLVKLMPKPPTGLPTGKS